MDRLWAIGNYLLACLLLFIICVFTCIQSSEDNFMESVLSFHFYVGSKDGITSAAFLGKCLYTSNPV